MLIIDRDDSQLKKIGALIFCWLICLGLHTEDKLQLGLVTVNEHRLKDSQINTWQALQKAVLNELNKDFHVSIITGKNDISILTTCLQNAERNPKKIFKAPPPNMLYLAKDLQGLPPQEGKTAYDWVVALECNPRVIDGYALHITSHSASSVNDSNRQLSEILDDPRLSKEQKEQLREQLGPIFKQERWRDVGGENQLYPSASGIHTFQGLHFGWIELAVFKIRAAVKNRYYRKNQQGQPLVFLPFFTEYFRRQTVPERHKRKKPLP